MQNSTNSSNNKTPNRKTKDQSLIMKTINQSPDMNLSNNKSQISEIMNLENHVSTVSATPNRAARRSKQIYTCTQSQLSRICNLAWLNCKLNLDAFKRFSGSYDPQFVDDKIKEIEAAKGMKNQQQRNLETSDAREALTTIAAAFCENFINLKRFITKAFPTAVNTNLLAAGSKSYNKASKNDWEALDVLLQNATDFVNLKKDELMKNNNMPDAFLVAFLANSASCNGLLQAYKQTEIIKKTQTSNKVGAFNNIYNATVAMLADGQVIFKKDQALRETFVWTKLYEQIKAQSASTIKGYALDSNGNGIKDVLISIQRTEFTTTTNKYGFFSIGRLSGQAYMIDAAKQGLITVHEGVILKGGTAKHLNLTMEPVVVEQSVDMPSQQESKAV